MRWRLAGSRRHSSCTDQVPIAVALVDRADIDDERARRHLGGEIGGRDAVEIPTGLLQYLIDAAGLHRSTCSH